MCGEMIMMIIDAHCHIWEKKHLGSVQIKEFQGLAKKWGWDLELLMDGTADRLISEMDEAGIDQAIVLALDAEFMITDGVTAKEYNDYVAQQLRAYPDRLIGFCGIDPRRGRDAIHELERCVGDLGFRGVKLWPLTGFYPDDPAFYSFYERVQEMGISILCHTGRGPSSTYLKYNRPAYVDTIAVDFPHIPIIMAHIGIPWTQEAFAVAGKNPNVYVDLSSLQSLYKQAPVVFFQTLSEAKMTCGVEKILFGSDWPLFTPFCPQPEWVDAIQTMALPPPLQAMGVPEFTEAEKRLILGGNAKKALGI